MSNWLSLKEYSYTQDVSISTLRRKIKNREMEYKLKKGRYLLKAPKSPVKPIPQNSDYQSLLKQKEAKIKSLTADREDLLSLLDLLEQEKLWLLNYVRQLKKPESKEKTF